MDKKGGILFRRRFRVSYPMFEQIVTMTKENRWFSDAPDCSGRRGAPLELKILGVLRVLGRGYCFDGIEELCFISAEVIRVFFHKFTRLFSVKLFLIYCNAPLSEDEIERTMKIYRRLGLPGCIGSVDCVHIRWERCPVGERSQHKGKEGFPTLSYEVTVDHSKKIIAVTEGHPGSRNDKTIVKFDGFVSSIHDRSLYGDISFKLLSDNDQKITVESEEMGAYLISDGGYPKWRTLQCPLKHTVRSKHALWSKWVDSVRKDVECVFGILKGRWRCLKLPIFYQNKKDIDNMFFACCIFHNMLLANDGFDVRWEENINWLGQDGNHADEDLSIFRKHSRPAKNLTSSTDFSLVGVKSVYDKYDIFHEGGGDNESSHHNLREKLVTHFCKQHENGNVEWLK